MQNSRSLSAGWVVVLSLALPVFTVATLPAACHQPPSLQVSLIDQLPPQGLGPSFQGLDERRRGPIFRAALREVGAEGRLPPVEIINRDLTLPATVADESPVAPGTRLVRIYLTQWSRTPLGGIADTEILCRFFVELRRDGRVEKKLGPFFARKEYDTVTSATPQDRWARFQAVAKLAVEENGHHPRFEALKPRTPVFVEFLVYSGCNEKPKSAGSPPSKLPTSIPIPPASSPHLPPASA